jgi:NifU-like protein involved in Fe-S cluster formation
VTKGTGTDANPLDGDKVTIELEITNGVVSITKAVADGCDSIGLMVRSVEELAHRKTEDEAWMIDVAAVKRAMVAVSAESERCALTAVGALRSALVDARVRARVEGVKR